MREDPAAIEFLNDILSGQDSVLTNDLQDVSIFDPSNPTAGANLEAKRNSKNFRVKKVVRKAMKEHGYHWPYYDSYVPGLGMDKHDKRIVRKGVI